MPKHYKHLSLDERSKISVLQAKGESIRSIGKIIGRSASTISRELKRDEAAKFRGDYIAGTTHQRVQENWRNSHKRPNTFLNQRNVAYFIECELKRGYTPDIICHELLEKFEETVSHETLYKYIYSKGWKLSQYLLRSFNGRKPKKTERPKRQGTVENINGLIRRFFPIGTNFDNKSEEAIAYVEDWINNRPMKILNYMTPNQKFQQCSVALAS